MSNSFVPLIPTPAAMPAAPHNLVPLPAPGSHHEGFAAMAPQPLIEAGSVPETAPPAPGGHSAPTVTFRRDGDRVTQIEIRCSCGEVIQLDCDYGGTPQR